MELLENYREELTNTRNCISSEGIESDKTINSYYKDVKRLFEFLGHEDVTKVSSQDVDQFLKLNAPATANHRFMSINNFYKFLNESGITDNCPVIKGITYKKVRKIPKRMSIHMTKAETFIFMAEASKKVKNYAMMMLFINTGIRESEFCNLKKDDYDGVFIKYVAKGNEERIVPVGTVTAEAINEYLKTRNDNLEYLFVSNWKRKYSTSGIYGLVENIVQRAGIKKKITPHKLRHTCAAAMRTDGADIYSIAKKLGQKDIKVTEIYLRTLVDERDIEVAEKGSFNIDFRTHPNV